MNVIGHQAPSENAEAVTFRLPMQELQIEGAILIGKEHVLPVVASLGGAGAPGAEAYRALKEKCVFPLSPNASPDL